ncbi:ribonuclease P protein component [Pseudolactococcus reticulitermitis]|uniref:Ribonuclease P protein component n=1 Tax=Pseudolactococcus reticulitermitis TaxID=2025039 RepID=A0A224X6V0_9LACT|nr:ribonuclease P protein component [Lactococcus reticulitermitis]GAX48276.1 ribonuclease P protein component [Lactococcus reticulitermitis]
MAIKKALRIKKKIDFDNIFSARKSTANKKFVVYQLPSQTPHFRVAISVSKKLGNAVTRNRVKRLVRHALMPLSANLSQTDFVIVCRKGVETLTFAEVQKNLMHVLKVAKIYHKTEA